MRIFPFALVFAAIFFSSAIVHLNQSVKSYYDLVALLIVFGGTSSVGMMILPWEFKKDISKSLKSLFYTKTVSQSELVRTCYKSAISGETPNQKNELWQTILSEGIELLNLGLSKDKVEKILSERIHNYMNRQRKVVSGFRNLAKYPPAFGLMGTVLGLVNVMKGVSNGMNAKQTAFEMALALVATMYGLIVSNLLVNPAGENILSEATSEEAKAMLAFEAVGLYADSASPLESQELLNSHVLPEDQIPLFQSFGGGNETSSTEGAA